MTKAGNIIHTVSCHAEGEVGDVIVDGVAPPPGDTLWQQRNFIASDETLRNFMLNEPRGGVFRHVNLLVPPINPNADAAFIIMEPEDTPPMSGSNTICVATVLLNTGILPMQEPVTKLTLEVPGGLIAVEAECKGGKATRITITNLPSFADKLDVQLELEGLGTFVVDTAFGGDSFVLIDAKALGFSITPDEAADLASLGAVIVDAANDQIGFSHPTKDWSHISFCQFTGSLERHGKGITGKNTVSIKPGKLDRSPTGTGCSARLAVLHAKKQIEPDETYLAKSIIGSEFICRITGLTVVGGKPAIIPSISGRAWITGTHQHTIDSDDPWPQGYRIADTWPRRN